MSGNLKETAEAVMYVVEGEMVRMGISREHRIRNAAALGRMLTMDAGGRRITVDLGNGAAQACASAVSQLDGRHGAAETNGPPSGPPGYPEGVPWHGYTPPLKAPPRTRR